MIAFICAAMVAVESFLYSLLQSMGLIGANYNDISNSFPDNTVQQNQVLYSIANNPTSSNGGFTPIEHRYNDEVANLFYWFVGTSEFGPFATENWDALMNELGFSVVDNNVQLAVDNGYSVNGAEWVGTMSNGVTSAVVSYVGYCSTAFRSDHIPDNVGYVEGMQGISRQNKAVWRWSYGDQVIYSSTPYSNLSSYLTVYYNSYGNARFVTSNNKLYWVDYAHKEWTPFPISFWQNQGIVIEDANTFTPTESVALGEDYLSFGDEDNPVVGVEYDSATGITTYKYKDGTTSTTPPAILGNSVALSPSITQPLTNYIINEGDITNIYNPDSAIPSDSSIPFDFTSLGDLLYKEFTPVSTFDFKPPYNRLVNKYDWETPFKKICQKFNITGRKPSYIISFVWFNKQISFDIFCWCDYLLDSRNYSLYMKFMRFFLYFGMVSGCLLLFLRSINVKLGTVIVSKG